MNAGRTAAALACVAVWSLACPVEVPVIEEQEFSCRSDEECAPGYDCLGGRCVAEGQDAGLATADAQGGLDYSIADHPGGDQGPADTAQPDTSQPDTSLADTSLPDTSLPDTANASCDELYGGVPGYILCWDLDDRCAFNAEMYAYPGQSCDELCQDFGGACLDGIDNPNDEGRECEENGSDGCFQSRGTELCVCTRY